MTDSELRSALANPQAIAARKFEMLRHIAQVLNRGDETAGRDLLLRAMEHRAAFAECEGVLQPLLREVGLFPYLDESELGLADALAYEYHRPSGLAEDMVFHREQAEVYRRLMAGESVIVSAPTSFGKSKIIDALIASRRYRNIVIVVPTIALIDETRRPVATWSSYYKVVTQISQPPAESNIFVFTAERVNSYDLPKVDLFVIDEFYKIGAMREDPKRTAALNQAFYRLAKTGAQFYLLGPNVREIPAGLQDRFRCQFFATQFATVAADHVRVPRGGDDLETLVSLLSELRDEPTLVFCKSPKRSQEIAAAVIASGIVDEAGSGAAASEWMQQEFHAEWTIAAAVRHGVGVHHGKLPRSLGQYMVRAFNGEVLKLLVCTSTLIEGVNTKAKNIVILDNVIARRKYDFFTFNNIRGRAGRMFQHFVGKVFLFHEPPAEELPFVDFPVFSQTDETPESVLIQMDGEDLTQRSRERLEQIVSENVLPMSLLRKHSGVEPGAMVALAEHMSQIDERSRRLLSWNGFPRWEELKLTCELAWMFLVPEKRLAAVSSGSQLAVKLRKLAQQIDIKTRIAEELNGSRYAAETPDEAVERVLEFDRTWASFEMPRLLRAMSDINQHVLGGTGNYHYYASSVEHLFRRPEQMALEEFGLPIQLSDKLLRRLPQGETLDRLLARIKKWNPTDLGLDSFEEELLRECQAGL
jgi:hypothetical protein